MEGEVEDVDQPDPFGDLWAWFVGVVDGDYDVAAADHDALFDGGSIGDD